MSIDNDEVKQNAAKQLVKLADLMESCEHGSREYKAYAKEYRIYAKIVMPEYYKSKKRKLYNPEPGELGTNK